MDAPLDDGSFLTATTGVFLGAMMRGQALRPVPGRPPPLPPLAPAPPPLPAEKMRGTANALFERSPAPRSVRRDGGVA